MKTHDIGTVWHRSGAARFGTAIDPSEEAKALLEAFKQAKLRGVAVYETVVRHNDTDCKFVTVVKDLHLSLGLISEKGRSAMAALFIRLAKEDNAVLLRFRDDEGVVTKAIHGVVTSKRGVWEIAISLAR